MNASDSELLTTGYTALAEAHTLGGTLFDKVKTSQELGQPVATAESLTLIRGTREQLQKAVCAFSALESRALGNKPPKLGD